MNKKQKDEIKEYAHEKVHEAISLWAKELSKHTKPSPETDKKIRATQKEFSKWADLLQRMTEYVDTAEKQVNNIEQTGPKWHVILNSVLAFVSVCFLAYIALKVSSSESGIEYLISLVNG